MTWLDLSARHAARPEYDTLRISVNKDGINVRPPHQAVKALGWKLGDRIRPLLGQDDHTGLLRLMKGDTGWKLQRPGGGKTSPSLALKFPTFAGAPTALASTAIATFSTKGGALEFRLPWLDNTAAAEAHPVPEPGSPREVLGDPRERVTVPAELPPVAEPEVSAAAAETEPEPEPERLGPPTPREFPVQTRTLPEVDAERTPSLAELRGRTDPALSGGHPSTWPSEKRRAFIDAVLDRKPDSELSRIAQRPVGSLYNIIKKQLGSEIEAARKARSFKHGPLPPTPSSQAKPSTLPPAPKYAAGPAADEVAPAIPEHILEFVRTEIEPVLRPLGRKIVKNRDDTGLVLDGTPVTLDELVIEANRILADLGDELLTVPAAA